MTLKFMARLICDRCGIPLLIEAGKVKDARATQMSVRATAKRYHGWRYTNEVNDATSRIRDYCGPCARDRGVQ